MFSVALTLAAHRTEREPRSTWCSAELPPGATACSGARENVFNARRQLPLLALSLCLWRLHREYISVPPLRGRLSNDAEAVCGREYA